MKEVQDRVVQFSNRYKLTNAETGEVLGTFDFDEVTGTVQQVGTEIDKELFDSIANDLAARVVSAGGELSGTIVTFSDISGTAANVASGETSATLWGKVKNWFSRLKALAFKNKVSAGDFEAGAIKNADVAADAAIAQSKINGLETALDAKANDADLAAIAKSGDLADATQDATHRVVTDTEKATWNAKQNAIMGAASTIVSSDLTESRALVSDASGKVAVSDVTATELGYLDGVKSNIQEQLDNISSGTGFVSTSPQNLTTEQQAQARENIGAASKNNLDKALYNLAPTDTVVTDSDDTVTVTRNRDGVTYTETLPADVPLNQLDQNMTDIVHDEVEKTLNLAPWNGTEDYTTAGNAWKYLFIAKVDIGKNYYFTINNFTQSRVGYGGLFLCQNDTTEIPVLYQNLIGSEYLIQTWEHSANGNLSVNFTPSKEYVLLGFSTDGSTKTIHVEDIMLVEGSHAYPYQPYNGAIVHKKQLDAALEDYLPRSGGTMSGEILMDSHPLNLGGDSQFIKQTDGNYVNLKNANYNVVNGIVQEAGQRVYSPNNKPTKSDIGLGNVDNVQQYSSQNPPPYPVTSVNGMTGDVNIRQYEHHIVMVSPSTITSGNRGRAFFTIRNNFPNVYLTTSQVRGAIYESGATGINNAIIASGYIHQVGSDVSGHIQGVYAKIGISDILFIWNELNTNDQAISNATIYDTVVEV